MLRVNLMTSTSVKKETESWFSLCSIPSSFKNICKHLGTEETSCWTFGRAMLPHSCLIEDSSGSAVLGLLCCIWNVFSWWKVWTAAGQSSTRTLLLQSHDVGVDAVCGLTLSCWNRQGLPSRRCHLDGSISALKPDYTFLHWWSLSRCAGFQFHRH